MGKESFLPEYMVMLDAEMTGVNPKCDRLLQVAMVKMKLENDQYKVGKSPLVVYLKTDLQPSNDFHKEFLTGVFDQCNKSVDTEQTAKAKIDSWLGPDKGSLMACGDCVITDLEFLHSHDLLDRPGYDSSGKPVLGTFHYEIFDLNAVKAIFRHKLGLKPEIKPATPAKHEALADCYNQINELNEYLKVLLV